MKQFAATLTLGLLFCLFCFRGTSTSQTGMQDSLRAERKRELSVFFQTHYPVSYSLDTLTNNPTELRGDGLANSQTKTDPVEVAYEFFEQNRGLYGINDVRSELKVGRVKNFSKEMGGALVVLQQVYKGLGVSGGVLRLNFNSMGKLTEVRGSFIPDLDLSINPKIDKNGAVNLAKQDLQSLNKSITIDTAYLVIFPVENKYRLAWIVRLKASDYPFGDWIYDVDANSGTILSKRNLVIYEFPPGRLPKKESLQVPIAVPVQTAPADSSLLRKQKPAPAPQKTGESKRKRKKGEVLPDSLVLDSAEIHLQINLDSILREKPGEKKDEEGKGDSTQSRISAANAGLVIITTQNFEGAFPSPGWFVFDNDGATNGELYWGKDTFLPHLGSWSAWCGRPQSRLRFDGG